MSKYKCTICGHIYDEKKEGVKFSDLPESWICPLCNVPKSFFEKIDESDNNKELERTIKNNVRFNNAIYIDKNNVSIERVESKCIDCGICLDTCIKREGIKTNSNTDAICVNCGQCIATCPTGALIPKQNKDKLKKMIKDGKICIAYTSPSVRVAIGEEFNMDYGSFAQGKLISALRKIGFNYVLDVTFGADLTIMEEANELVKRIKDNRGLPMFTSCCPSWVKYAEIYYPEILDHISSCKSPIGMQGEIVKNYFTEKNNINANDVYTVAITPCTAKKYEILREEIGGTDLVITTKELSDILKEENIDFTNLEDSNYDVLLGEGSGAGMIFGNTGGVMEAALRTTYNLLTGNELDIKDIEFNDVRGIKNVKESTIDINGLKLNIAVVNQMSSAKQILEDVKNGTSKYHYIEIMNCLGGCIGGGGQPKFPPNMEIEIKEKRINSLYNRDKVDRIRCSHNNEEIKRLYKEFLEKPLSERSKKLLHTKYYDKSNILKNKGE